MSSNTAVLAPRRKKAWALVGAWVIVVLLVGAVWRSTATRPTDTLQNKGPSNWFTAGVGQQDTAVPIPEFRTGLEDLPPSLRGTEVDGELAQDAQGRLKITRGVRNLFDYFLSTRGEQAEAIVHARIRAYVRSHLEPQAATQALGLFDQYLAYLQQLDEAVRPTAPDSLTELRQRLSQLEQMRAASFSPDVVQAFFGEDSAYDHYTVDKLGIMADGTLSGPQKASQLQALRQALPASLREHLNAAEQVQTLDQVSAEWAQRGGTATELRSIRENLVGAAAADRLEALDSEEAAWDTRVNQHLQARALILADVTLAEATRRERVQSLRSAHFNGPDLQRIEMLERIADAKQVTAGR